MSGFFPDDWRFLYGRSAGRIDRNRWIGGAFPLLFVLSTAAAPLSGVVASLARERARGAPFDSVAVADYIYLAFGALAALATTFCWINLTTKRFRDRRRRAPKALAALLPLSALCAGLAHGLYAAALAPRWGVVLADGTLIMAAIWTLAEIFDLIPAWKNPWA